MNYRHYRQNVLTQIIIWKRVVIFIRCEQIFSNYMGMVTGRSPHQVGTKMAPPSSEYICGGIASLVNIAVTFPLNKVMFRQQIEGVRVHRAFKQVYREGLAYLYRGLLPPLLQRTANVSLMFGTYAQYSSALERTLPPGYWGVHVIAALGAGTTEAILTPLERVQVILQARDYHGNLDNTLHAFRTLSRLGVMELYRGLTAILLRNGPSNILFFGLREPFKEALPSSEGELSQTLNAFISGAGLGAGLSTAFFPLNVVKTRMQRHIGGKFLTLREALDEVLAERRYKWRLLFRGVHINYTRSFVSWGIINAVYELLRKHCFQST